MSYLSESIIDTIKNSKEIEILIGDVREILLTIRSIYDDKEINESDKKDIVDTYVHDLAATIEPLKSCNRDDITLISVAIDDMIEEMESQPDEDEDEDEDEDDNEDDDEKEEEIEDKG